MMKQAVVLLSGGLDSATAAAIAQGEGYAICALSFAYGQRHALELAAAERLAKFFKAVEHKVITIDLRAFGGSALTAEIAVPEGGDAQGIPITYVPARNTIFLAYALAWAEVRGSRDIFIGVNAVDYSGYPDCRPEYIAAFQKLADLATRAGVEGRGITIHTPLISLSKAEIIKTGIALGVDYSLTRSCYNPDEEDRACGACDSCRLRRKGFRDAGVEDPTRYQH
ncbi:MAG: 7-cyano-7-deazaguanine synthase QueC [Planctomycetes bacterium]|nr:7-cyano-7-deazaguanine synthase QueC [Planctomycetota bacterium]